MKKIAIMLLTAVKVFLISFAAYSLLVALFSFLGAVQPEFPKQSNLFNQVFRLTLLLFYAGGAALFFLFARKRHTSDKVSVSLKKFIPAAAAVTVAYVVYRSNIGGILMSVITIPEAVGYKLYLPFQTALTMSGGTFGERFLMQFVPGVVGYTNNSVVFWSIIPIYVIFMTFVLLYKVSKEH